MRPAGPARLHSPGSAPGSAAAAGEPGGGSGPHAHNRAAALGRCSGTGRTDAPLPPA
jgi:hypothetical protein